MIANQTHPRFDPASLAPFFEACRSADGTGYTSVPGGMQTLYGTSYGLMTRRFLGQEFEVSDGIRDFILGCQESSSGCFVGPELAAWSPPSGAAHDREHLLLHLACAALPVVAEFGWQTRFPLRFAHRFCVPDELRAWLERRNLRNAWPEGNNLLFVGQLLVWLRDVEEHPGAQESLDMWFDWLERHVDPGTGVWGTNLGCSKYHGVFGGYHQLLLYYYEHRPILYPEKLVDTVLELQHPDGGFVRRGGGGACEDVDGVDILVNLYKLHDYRRTAIRLALRRCLAHILTTQNNDGGFSYRKNTPQSHMGIPATYAPANVSTMFPTWFRVLTLALIGEILTDEPALSTLKPRFNGCLSMGWHRPWDTSANQLPLMARQDEARLARRQLPGMMVKRIRSTGFRIKRALRW